VRPQDLSLCNVTREGCEQATLSRDPSLGTLSRVACSHQLCSLHQAASGDGWHTGAESQSCVTFARRKAAHRDLGRLLEREAAREGGCSRGRLLGRHTGTLRSGAGRRSRPAERREKARVCVPAVCLLSLLVCAPARAKYSRLGTHTGTLPGGTSRRYTRPALTRPPQPPRLSLTV
jgi:hypothetical protein